MNRSNECEARKSYSIQEIENGFLIQQSTPGWSQWYAVDKESLLKRLNKLLEE